MKTTEFLHTIDDVRLVAAISEVEASTSGEIRIFVADKKVVDPLAEAEKTFLKLGMEKTRERNGVLIFIAPPSQNFAIIGDLGVHQKCGANFWDHVRDEMAGRLKVGDFTGGLVYAAMEVGKILATHFPPRGDNPNELSNSIERG